MLFNVSKSVLELEFHLILAFRESFLRDFQRGFYLYIVFISLKMIEVIELSSSNNKAPDPPVKSPHVAVPPFES